MTAGETAPATITAHVIAPRGTYQGERRVRARALTHPINGHPAVGLDVLDGVTVDSALLLYPAEAAELAHALICAARAALHDREALPS